MPVGRAAEARPVRLPPGDPVVQLAWADVGRARAIDRLEIEGGRSRPVVGVPYALSAFGYAGDRRTDALSRVRWHSLDPDILEVDSASGAARPLKAGIARVEAQIPGWRRASRSLDVTARLRTAPELETWSIGWDTRWYTFGQPTPVIDTLPDRRALRNNGDDSFSSGVLGLAPIDPLQGVALEAEISIHLTQPQWQTVNIGLTPFIDTSTITPEARLIGIPSRSAEQTKYCRVGIPAGEGWQYATLASASLGEESQNQTLPPRAKSGRWVRVRVQILPDGRCGAAIDGKPFFLSRSRFPMERQVQAQIWGSSVETKALVGPVRIWRGVPDDIDWETFARVQRGTGRAPR